jgi:hypothetical protein
MLLIAKYLTTVAQPKQLRRERESGGRLAARTVSDKQLRGEWREARGEDIRLYISVDVVLHMIKYNFNVSDLPPQLTVSLLPLKIIW